jgi:hypothetical protein
VLDGRDHGRNSLLIGHIGHEGLGTATGLSYQRHGLGKLIGGARDDGHLGACRRQPQCNRAAQAAAATGYYGDLS